MLVGVMCFLAYLSFFGPAKDPDPSRSLFAMTFTSTIAAGIGFFQVRRMRKTADDLSRVWFELTNEGIAVESPAGCYVLQYEGIRAVTIYRRYFSKPIARVVLHGQGGDAAFPGMEKPEEFLAELRQQIGASKFAEKRGLFV
jgi:hypothetical protein